MIDMELVKMNKKYKILALFGESGAGKDTIKDILVKHEDVNNIINTTTRPIREGEVNGVNYHFIDTVEFAERILNGDFIEATEFNDWFYGTSIHELDIDKINVGVFNIYGIECMLSDPRLEVHPVYVKTSDKIRLKRALEREDNPDCVEICRRFFADKKDFSDIPFSYDIVGNDDKSYYANMQITSIYNSIK
jgi:guanylate kinase